MSSNTVCILNKRSCLFSLPTGATKVTLSPTPRHPKHFTQCYFESAISRITFLSSFQTRLRARPYRLKKILRWLRVSNYSNFKQPAVTSIKKPLGLLLLKLKMNDGHESSCLLLWAMPMGKFKFKRKFLSA